ncbi:MAG TPA: EAL domain-containing protein [Steroidobacteraceae bacterium]|nr:EAL domain-containing protein [Steroidobacteraceae bacterium]
MQATDPSPTPPPALSVARRALRWLGARLFGTSPAVDWAALVARRTGYSVTVSDAQRRLIWVNDSFTRLTGYTPAEAIGRKTSALLYFEGTDAATVDRVRQSFARKQGERFEILVRGKDGREWWLDTDARPVLDQRGELLAWVCIQADVTEQVSLREAILASESHARALEEERRHASERLEIIADNVPGMIFQLRVRPNGAPQLLYASPGASAVYGLTAEELKREPMLLFKVLPAEDRAAQMQAIEEAKRTLSNWHIEQRIIRPDGTPAWIEGDALPRREADGSTIWIGYVGDVTGHKLAERELRASETKLRSLYDLSPLGIALNDRDGRFLQVNQAIEVITGYSRAEMLSTNWWDWAVDKDDPGQRARVESLLAAGRFGPVEKELVRKDGVRVPVQITGIIVRAPDGAQHIWSMVEDISVRKRSEQRIAFLAYHDALTGLENRFGLRAQLDTILTEGAIARTRTAVMLIDLDRFKVVNDTLGHDVGDRLLVEVARRIRASVRSTDVVARLGGDEFVVVIPGLREDMPLESIVRKMFTELRGNIDLPGRTIYCSCSVGVSVAPQDGADSTTLLKHADLAMYAAKAGGGDAFRLFQSSMTPGIDRLSIETELRGALERQELVLHYQPRVDTISGRPTGMEALVRWNHPTRGLLSPAVFIPIAEETGLIEPLGEFVLREACKDLRAWLDMGREPLRVSVNLSPIQFAREDLAERVADAIAAAGIEPRLLELEITESAAMSSPEQAVRHLAKLKTLGVTLAIDDFGTGHSSLSRLKLFNVDCLKIDRSLVKDCAADAYDGALCRATIALGRALGLEVVAEGVETHEQWQFLAQERCSNIQGYLLARPMPRADVFAFLKSALEAPRLRSPPAAASRSSAGPGAAVSPSKLNS